MSLHPYFHDERLAIYHADAVSVLAELPETSVQCVVTSPPYWGLRDYRIDPIVWPAATGQSCRLGSDGQEIWCGHEWGAEIPGDPRGGSGPNAKESYAEGGKTTYARQVPRGSFCQKCGAWRGCLGLEPTPELYVEHLMAIFQDVRRVLRDDGTLWLNMGDSYANETKWGGQSGGKNSTSAAGHYQGQRVRRPASGLKPKDLVGIPWRVAFALQADGWYLRADIIWHKPNSKPESVTDRPTKAHEYLFLLSKSERYFYNGVAIREPDSGQEHYRNVFAGAPSLEPSGGLNNPHKGLWGTADRNGHGRNRRSVWTIPTHPFPEAHFATYPEALVEPCILAGTNKGCTVLDPFHGSGTTAVVALQHGCRYIGIEPSEEYIKMSLLRLEPQIRQQELFA